jgi:hypothetical protein
MSFNILDFGVITGHILAVSEDPGGSGWYIARASLMTLRRT